MVCDVLKNRVYDYIQSRDEGVTVLHLMDVFQEDNVHKINGVLIKLKNEGKIGKVRGNASRDPSIWHVTSNFRAIRAR